jgi:hypothetical protein
MKEDELNRSCVSESLPKDQMPLTQSYVEEMNMTLPTATPGEDDVERIKHNKTRKKKNVMIAGTTSAATTGAGIALMVVGGPLGIIAGGIIMGAGVSGAISTT